MGGQHYKAKESASFKCMVYYPGGETGVYYSRDWKHGKFRPDLGLEALETLVENRSPKIHYALIWDKRDGRDRLIRKYKGRDQGWIIHAPVEF